MSYLVIARKFRPQTFASVVGQEHITKALANAIVRGKVAHAFLFTGPRGVGKTSAARVLARALNCTGRSVDADLSQMKEADARDAVEPCGKCVNCQEIARSASLAVWEIDGASNNSVENVRELIDSLRAVPPASSRYKIYIIDEVHMLSTAAFNALLKSLEEPPPHTIFVFATTEPHKIPETVISRCQRYDFHKLSLDTIISQLQQIASSEGIEADEEVFEFIARKAEGGMRDAQSLLDRLNSFSGKRLTIEDARQVFGSVGRELFFNLGDAVLSRDATGALKLLDQAFEQSIDLRDFIGEFLLFFRNLLLIGVQGSSRKGLDDRELRRLVEAASDEIARLQKSAAQKSVFDLQRLFDLAQRTADQALMSNFPRYVLEAGVAKMASLEELQPLSQVISRLEGALQGKPSNGGGEVSTKAPAVAPQAEPVAAKPTRVDVPAPEPEVTAFDPNWSNFVLHARTRGEHVLAALLRRVTPTEFFSGKLTIEAGKFDLSTLRDAAILQSLRSCLHSHSGVDAWQIKLEEAGSSAPRQAGLAGEVEVSKQLPGSLAYDEAEKERERVTRVDSEARANPLVQSALSTFGGSKIERVSVLKR